MYALFRLDQAYVRVQDVPLPSNALAPQERVNAVRPFWENLPQEERVKLLTIDVAMLRERAKQLNEAAKQQAGEVVS